MDTPNYILEQCIARLETRIADIDPLTADLSYADRLGALESRIDDILRHHATPRTSLFATMAATVASGLMNRYSVNDLWDDNDDPNHEGRTQFAGTAVDIADRILKLCEARRG